MKKKYMDIVLIVTLVLLSVGMFTMMTSEGVNIIKLLIVGMLLTTTGLHLTRLQRDGKQQVS